MGHTVMLLAVAGLKEFEVQERAAALASGDWSSFTAAERASLFGAHKLTKTPWAVAGSDIQTLIAHFGPERAVDVVWYICWCNYMTRVADAFQIPLERENVFFNPESKPKKAE